MNLVDAMRTQYSAAKRSLAVVYVLSFIQVGLGVAVFFDPLKNRPFCTAVLVFLAQIAVFLFRNRSQSKYLFAEEIRQLALLQESLGQTPSPERLAKLALEVGDARDKEPPFLKAYYDSKATVGAARLAENLHESIFFTFYQAQRASWFFWGIAIVGASVTALATIILLVNGGVTDASTVAQIGILAVALFASGDVLQLALGFGSVAKAAEGLLSDCGAIRRASSPTAEDAIRVSWQYAVALAQAPVIPSWIYKMFQHKIQKAWDAYLGT